MSNPFPRRRMVTGLAATAAMAGAPLLSSCGKSKDTRGSAHGGRSDVTMPDYIPFDRISTDHPATEAGGLAAFIGLERPAPRTITEPPGNGGEAVSVLFDTEYPAPPALAENATWQNLNQQLGVDLQMQIVPSDEYESKLVTTLASDDLPDIMSLPATGQPQLPRMLASLFTDLSEYLAGDAICDYPMLAVRPESMWRSTVFDGKIYGVPTPNARASGTLVARKDLLDARGLGGEVNSAEEFTELCVALTDARSDQFADGRPLATLNFVCEMFGVPNKWRVDDDGGYVSQYATAEYKDAIDYLARLWKKGVFRPDAFYASTQAQIDHWGTGGTALFHWGGIGWQGQVSAYGPRDPEFDLCFLHPPRADGSGEAPRRLGSGVHRIGVIRRGQSPERVRELLRVLDYLAGSYGTAEYFDVNYGVEGKTWNWAEAEDGLWLPERTEAGMRERTMIQYLSGPLFVLSNPGHPEITTRSYEYMTRACETGDPDPTAGLHSETDATDGAKWDKDISNMIAEITQGRRTLSDWDDLIRRWRSDCGDDIAEEYAQANAALNG